MNLVYNDKYNIVVGGKDFTLSGLMRDAFNIPSDNELGIVEKESGVTIDDILNYEDNKSSILSLYAPQEQKEYNDNPKGLVKRLTKIKVPLTFIDKANEEQNKPIITPIVPLLDEPFDSFVGDTIKELVLDDRYAPSLNLRDRNRLTSFEKKNLTVNVYIQSRALGELINISAFVIACNTNVAHGGGNFQIVLPPIPAEYDVDGKLFNIFEEVNEKGHTTTYKHNGKVNYYSKGTTSKVGVVGDRLQTPVVREDTTDKPPSEYSSDEVAGERMYPRKHKPNGSETPENPILRNVAYFNVAISSQDIVYIKFEELQIEGEEGSRPADPFEVVSMENINNGFFDMIGLVDSVGESYNAPSADLSINISGRDLSKLLIEDGAYFFPATEKTGSELGYESNYFANREALKSNPTFVRLLGQIQDTSLYTEKTISYPITYIFDKLGTISVFKNEDVFIGLNKDSDNYMEAYIKRLDGLQSKKLLKDNEKDTRRGIWKLTNLIIDPSVEDKIIVDSSMATDSGSLMNFINKICDGRFVEFFTDTYNDRFYWIVRKPPFTYDSFLSNHRTIIEEENVINTSLSTNDSEAYSWYRLIPNSAYLGNVNFAKYYFPAQFFPRYAEVFGSQPLEVTSNYVQTGSKNTKEYGAMFANSYEELKFLIQSSAHLPFTRKGNITINGDRRIKKGSCVYLASTGELFYVDSVSNSYTVNMGFTDRVTNIQVSRGIVLEHAEKYFRVINYDNATYQDLLERKLNFTVNETYFDFLLAKKQFRE